MPLFRYKAKDAKGQEITGSMEAESRTMVISRLQAMSYFPVSIGAEADKTKSKTLGGYLRSRVTSNDVCEFYRQMADLIAAGIALVKARQIVLGQTPSVALRAIVSAPPKPCQMSACSATTRRVFFSPPPPIMIGMSRVGAGLPAARRCRMRGMASARAAMR